MLNKLLKRCMPWMDKGRWYQIRITGELVSESEVNVTDISYNESMFSRHESEAGYANIFFSNNINASVIDIKCINNLNVPNETINYVKFTSNPNDIFIDKSEGEYYIKVPCIPGTVDVWLFIKTN